MRALLATAIVIIFLAPAFGEVGPEHLRYLEHWRLHDDEQKVIKNLGPPPPCQR